MNLQLLCNQAVSLHQRGRLAEAERLYAQILEVESAHFTARHMLGVVRLQQGRNIEAIALIGDALKINPNAIKALFDYACALQAAGHPKEALAGYERVLAIEPNYASALNNLGNVLSSLNRFLEALASYDKALATNPDYAEALNNRGVTLWKMKRFEDALASYDKALAINPDYAEAWNSRGATLYSLKRFNEALISYNKSLAIKPDYARALKNLGSVLCEIDRVEEGFAAFTRYAELVYEKRASMARTNELSPPHKVRHDQEQRDYLAGGKAGDNDPAIDAMFRLADGSRLAKPAVNPDNAVGDFADLWQRNRPQIVVIDNLLTDEALDKLRRFCLGSTVWRTVYDNGYLGATPEHGFACPLLAQIADELRGTFPVIFGAHSLRYLWGFKYDSQLTGTNLHADKAAVNVNFWITPDESNLDPKSGGLVIWDVAAPLDWNFAKYNRDIASSRDFLARAGARPVTIPYRSNRAVIFDSNLFHETDKIAFKDGYLNRRINVTLLYGRRTADDE